MSEGNPGGAGQDADDSQRAVAVLYQLIDDGLPVMSCLMHPEPFHPDLCRHDGRLPAEVLEVALPTEWDDWLDLGDGWFAAQIRMDSPLIAALLIGAGSGKDEVRRASRQAVAKITEKADLVLRTADVNEDRHNPMLDEVMAI